MYLEQSILKENITREIIQRRCQQESLASFHSLHALNHPHPTTITKSVVGPLRISVLCEIRMLSLGVPMLVSFENQL